MERYIRILTKEYDQNIVNHEIWFKCPICKHNKFSYNVQYGVQTQPVIRDVGEENVAIYNLACLKCSVMFMNPYSFSKNKSYKPMPK